MLIPIQPNGSRPPFFLVHGLFGLSSEKIFPPEAFAPDQPVYCVAARGFDGREPPFESVRDMALGYVKEILSERPSGPYLIGGMCAGNKAAIEMARELMAQGRAVGPLFVFDPPIMPSQSPQALAALESGIRKPAVQRQLHEQARTAVLGLSRNLAFKMFDAADSGQVEVAAHVGAMSSLAFSRHVPAPFYGEVDLILCSERAPAFFDPEHAWQKILAGKRTVHVFEGDHHQLFGKHRRATGRLLRIHLDAAAAWASGAATDGPPGVAATSEAMPRILAEDAL